jgi:hypothetical protein
LLVNSPYLQRPFPYDDGEGFCVLCKTPTSPLDEEFVFMDFGQVEVNGASPYLTFCSDRCANDWDAKVAESDENSEPWDLLNPAPLEHLARCKELWKEFYEPSPLFSPDPVD